MQEQALVLGLELLTSGHRARIPPTLPEWISREVLTTHEFRAESESVCEQAREWTLGPGIEGLGIGQKISGGNPTGDLALRVYVDRKRPKRSLANPAPTAIEVPEVGELITDVVEIGHMEPQSFRERARPAMPGCGLGNVAVTVGTFGCLVKRKDDDGLYILSNCHVLTDVSSIQVDDLVIQPARTDGGDGSTDALADVAEFVSFEFDDLGFPNLVDAAIARVRRRDWVVREIRELGVPPTGIGRVLRRGMNVKKVGRTTGYTTGIIQDIHLRTALSYTSPNGAKTPRVGFRDQVLCTRYSDGGDSGSIVLNSGNRVIGLHFAGSSSSSVFSRIHNVMRLLKIELA